MSALSPSPFGASTLIKGRWKILRKIGQGAFGEIFSGRNVVTSELVAIKIEKADSKKQVLKLEIAVLKKLQSCPLVVTFITCGRHNEYNYMVMELLGENLSEIRRRQVNGKFSLLTTLKLGMQMLKGIESVHDLGYLHRDIKPKRQTCYLIDFGLSRRYLLPNGEVRPTGFRGTARYASINSHLSKDLGRRDDLWSLFYVLVEFAQGFLPWRRLKDKDAVGEAKIKCSVDEICQDLPPEFLMFNDHLQSLDYCDRPNYSYLTQLLSDLYTQLGGDDTTPFDWDRVIPAPQRPRSLPSLMDLSFIKVASNLEAFPAMRVPASVKKRMLDFIIRIKNGRVPRNLMDRLLDVNLTDLDLLACELSDSDYHQILSTCTKLKSLTLGSSTDNIVRLIAQYNRSLEQLSVSCHKTFSNKAIKLLAENCEKLTVLKLKCSEKVSDKSVEHILRNCTNLEELALFGCKRIKVLAKTKKRPIALRRLNLSYCELSKKGWKYLVDIAADLQALSFSPLSANFKITATDFMALVNACTSLHVLDIGNYHFEMDPLLLETSRHCPHLTTLLLDGIGMTDYGLQNVVQQCSKLETLRFRYGDGVTDASLHQIARSCSNIKSLTLDFWNKFNRLSVSDHAIRNLLCTCTNLTELSLCNCSVLTAACFPDHGYFPYLVTLNLSECVQLNDFAIRKISESCPNLRRFDLNNLNYLTEASLQSIAVFCPQLEDLYLISCSCLADDAIKHLLRSMPKLFIQVTRYTDVDMHGVLKEVHATTVDKIFSYYPNTYREKALERTRKRLY